MAGKPSAFELQLQGYRLTLAQITYRMPDHPRILQEFIWQHYDLAPRYPELHNFLDFWVQKIEGKLHSVHVARLQLIGPSEIRQVATFSIDGSIRLH